MKNKEKISSQNPLLVRYCPKCGDSMRRYKILHTGGGCDVEDLCTSCVETFLTNGLFLYP